MTYNTELTDRVRRALSQLPDVQEKKMFGSIGFIVRGRLCLGVGDHADHQMMVRVGPTVYEEALRRPGASPAVMRGRERKGYIFLTTEAVNNKTALDYWLTLALMYNGKIT